MHLGGAGRAAAAVSPGTSAKQDDDIPWIRRLTDHRPSRSRSQYRSDLHTLRHIIRVIDLLHHPRRKTDLVTVRTITVGRLADQLLLRKLPLHGIPD